MRRRVASLVLVLATLVAGPADAEAGGGIVPPLRFDIGTLALRGEGTPTMASQLLLGLHWASLHPGNPSVDVGVGMIATFTSIPDGLRLPGDRKDTDGYVGATGGYLEFARKIAGGDHWRTWLSGRGELTRGSLGGRAFVSLGGAARITTELFAGVAGGGGNGFVLGSAGLGLYAEASYREQPANLAETGFGAGVSFRLPLVVAIR